MPLLLRALGVDRATPAERRATAWIAAMACLAFTSTFLLRPLRDQFGVDQGVERMPFLYSLTLVATVVLVVPFWWLANRMPSRRFVPWVLHGSTVAVGALAIGLLQVGEYDWKQVPWLGNAFWGGYSALNVAIPTLVWIHAVEHFRTEQARRLFGLIAVGSTVGTVIGSWLAGLLAKDVHWPPWAMVALAGVGFELALLAFVASLRPCRELDAANAGVASADLLAPRVASGGLTEGLRLLARDRRAQGIAIYMVLLAIVATAFYAAQTEFVGRDKSGGRAQHGWLASVEFWRQTFVLALQLFCTGRLLQRWPGSVLLVSLPIVSIFGLGALWLAPVLLTINLVQIGRGGAQYAFEKPAREVLYTPLSLATKHKVKFLLDTFAFRLGDLLGAWLAVALRELQVGTGGIVAVTVVVALAWIALGLVLGRRARS